MPARSLVAIGASAGGVESLQRFVSVLPAGLDAAVAVVLHVQPRAKSVLAHILQRAGVLSATEPEDGEPIEASRIYTARPGYQLLVERGRFRLVHGGPADALCPAVDPLFRSVAELYGPRAIGVVLSGSLADGTAGLAAIKRQGGWAMVEDPERASHPGMPTSAVAHVAVDVVGSCEELAQRTVDLLDAWSAGDSPPVLDLPLAGDPFP
jgi:two-component system chemotaxis response regulator CheB